MNDLVAVALVEGHAEGNLVVWDTPLSFWGGYDSATGEVIDRSHPAFGSRVGGKILAMPAGRGSSSASSVLAEAIRLDTAPAAILMTAADPIILVGAMVALKLYGKACPIFVIGESDFAELSTGLHVRIKAENGSAIVAIAP